MKKRLGSVFLWLVLGAVAGGAAPAPQTGFDPFFAAFRSAVARRDAKAVADMTKLPFLFDSQPRDHSGFQKIYGELFDGNVRACFKSGRAVRESDRFVVSCGRYIFYFGVVGDRYRLIEFAADPEADGR